MKNESPESVLEGHVGNKIIFIKKTEHVGNMFQCHLRKIFNLEIRGQLYSN